MILTVTNSKGGVGKTTTAVNLATGFANKKRATLLIDLDPQAHASRCLLRESTERSVCDFIMERPSQASRSIVPTDFSSLDIVPASARLTQTAELLSTRIRREERLWRALKTVTDDYRNIVVDCPPTLGILTHNAIIAADLLVVPVQPGVGAIAGLDALLDTARELRDEDNVPYRILVTMYDLRTTRTNVVFGELLETRRRRFFETVISRNESLNQANLAGKPVAEFMPASRGAQEYGSLCEEIMGLRIRSRD